MMVSVPACAPATPPLTGASRHATPASRQRPATCAADRGPRRGEVDVGPYGLAAPQLAGDRAHDVGRRQADEHGGRRVGHGGGRLARQRSARDVGRHGLRARVEHGERRVRRRSAARPCGRPWRPARRSRGGQPTRRCRAGLVPGRVLDHVQQALAIVGVLTTAVLPAGGAHAPFRRQPYASTSCPLAGASRPASHGVLWPTALLSAHTRCCVCSVARSSPAAPRAVAAGSGGFSAWRRGGSCACPACQEIGVASC